jgi:glucosylceramidase
LEPKLPESAGQVLILSTSKNGLRFEETTSRFGDFRLAISNGPYHYGTEKNSNLEMVKHILKIPDRFEEPLESVVNINVNRTSKHQKIIGFGGAFTGSVSHNLKQLKSDKLREYVYEGYYSKQKGNGYNLMRFPIGGCDFDIEPWAYNEFPEHDPFLTGFTKLDQRDLEKIEQVKELKKVSKNYDIKVVGAAWSPPRWMKTNGEWSGFSALRDEYFQTWAEYHVKYLELMKQHNFPFWAVSTGNEPLNAVIYPHFVKFMTLGWLPREQGRWLGDHFGPAMKNSSITKKIKASFRWNLYSLTAVGFRFLLEMISATHCLGGTIKCIKHNLTFLSTLMVWLFTGMRTSSRDLMRWTKQKSCFLESSSSTPKLLQVVKLIEV